MAKRLRAAFLGSPELAVPTLQLLAERCEVTVVITQPDRPAGRGRSLTPPPIKHAALALGLPVWQPESLKDHEAEAVARLGSCDLAVVLAYGALLRRPLLAATCCVNLHASLLPRWRGASPLQAAIRAGDRQTGVSVMRMVSKLDAGPVWLQEAIDLPSDATLPWLHDRMAELCPRALDRFLAAWPPPEPSPQDEALVTLCGKLLPEDGRLDPFQHSATALAAQVRAYTPAPGCWLPIAGERFGILAAEARPALAEQPPPGSLSQVHDEIHLACAEGSLALTQLRPPGRRPMDARAFCNGHQLPPACDPPAT